MAFTQTDIDDLDAIIAGTKGVKEASFGDQSMRFNSVEDMLRLRAEMVAQVQAATRRRFRVAAVDKGV